MFVPLAYPVKYSKGNTSFEVTAVMERKGHSEGALLKCSDGINRTEKYLDLLVRDEGWFCPGKSDNYHNLYDLLS